MLRDKNILVLSPQAWGKMHLSKHHYAEELANRGNRVYFLNPPHQDNWKINNNVEIEESNEQKNLFLISHTLFFPYDIKFHAPWLYQRLIYFQVRKILKQIGPIDIIWSFDLGNLYPLDIFPGQPLKIFHPVDEPLNPTAIKSANGADILFSVTREIIEKYSSYHIRSHFVNHGVSDDFVKKADPSRPAGSPVHVGFSGNLLRPDIDRKIFLSIIRGNPKCKFDCWGSYQISQSNIGGAEDTATMDFISELKSCQNVVLHGVVSSATLAVELQKMDAFLICYDVNLDQSKGTNYHKIMEYLGVGRVIISNNVTTYSDHPELIQMVSERDSNEKLPALFKNVIDRLDTFNSIENQEKRIQFAKDNTYQEQLNRIESFLYDFKS